MQKLKTFIKGLVVGGSMVVPGVSGGTMAMLLGIYDTLIEAVNSLTRRKWLYFPFLIIFGLGALTGIIVIARPLEYLLQVFRKPTLFFFMGAVAGGIPLMCKQTQITKFSPKVVVYPLIGATIVASFHFLPTQWLQLNEQIGFFYYLILFFVGILIAAALVLPGISGSFMLLVLGLYDRALLAASAPFQHLAFIVPLALGALVGIFLTTGVLEKAMKHYPQGTYLIILGFVLGSLAEVWPGMPSSKELPVCLLLFAVSALCLGLMGRWEGQKEKK